MIFKRAVAKLRAQDWTAIGIEFAIVVAGVFVGTWVADWNSARADRRAVERLVDQLEPKFRMYEQWADDDVLYYQTVRDYAKVAEAGFARDPKVDDRTFVIAAFQATQLDNFNSNKFANGTMITAEEVRKIDDTELRDHILDLIAVDNALLDLLGEGSPYREQVRSLIPDEVQQAILKRCGDRAGTPPRVGLFLPPSCDLALDPAVATTTAAALRSEPGLAKMLTSHMAHVTRHIGAATGYGTRFLHDVVARIEETHRRL